MYTHREKKNPKIKFHYNIISFPIFQIIPPIYLHFQNIKFIDTIIQTARIKFKKTFPKSLTPEEQSNSSIHHGRITSINYAAPRVQRRRAQSRPTAQIRSTLLRRSGRQDSPSRLSSREACQLVWRSTGSGTSPRRVTNSPRSNGVGSPIIDPRIDRWLTHWGHRSSG